jgi:glycosyltransferase involved in cell wall biosynthesis
MLTQRQLRVSLATHLAAFDPPGGGERQLREYFNYIKTSGLDVALYDLWEPRVDETDLFHIFSVAAGMEHFCHHLNQRNRALIVSPNLWMTKENIRDFPAAAIRMSLLSATRIICNSKLESQSLADALDIPIDHFSTIYNGVSDNFWPLQNSRLFRETFSIAGPYVLNVANIEPRKNQLRLIQALETMPDLTLVIAGHVRDQKYAAECREVGGARVKFVGPLEHGSPSMLSAYSDCELFALPSMLETPGLSALEALACGANVIVTEVGSTTEYFQDVVNYVNPHEVESIRCGIELARQKPKSFSNAFFTHANFGWQNTLSQLVPLYQSVISKAPPPMVQTLPVRSIGDGRSIILERSIDVCLPPGNLNAKCTAASDGRLTVKSGKAILYSCELTKDKTVNLSVSLTDHQQSNSVALGIAFDPANEDESCSLEMRDLAFERLPAWD